MKGVSSGGIARNIQANFVGLLVASIASVLSAPLIYRHLGREGYGLLGLFMLVLGMLPVIDLGVLPGVSRAVAWYRGSAGDGSGKILTMFRLASTFMAGLVVVLLAIALVLVLLHPSFAQVAGMHGSHRLGPVLVLMAVALSIRMYCGLLRAFLMAMERQVQANMVHSVATLLRTLGALAFAVFTKSDIQGFFLFQVLVSLSEFVVYRRIVRGVLPRSAAPVPMPELLGHLRFGVSVSVLGLAWMLISNTDKILLGLSLSLSSYGQYSLAVHIAGALLLATAPVHAAVLPRLTLLSASGNENDFIRIYGVASALTVVIGVGAVTAIGLVGPQFVAFAEGGVSPGDSDYIAEIAFIYAIGYIAVAVSSLTYLMQSARGTVRLHAIGTALQAIVNTPLVGYFAMTGDIDATAMAFVCVNSLFLLIWLPIAQRRLLGRAAKIWWTRDILVPFWVASIAALISFCVVVLLPDDATMMTIWGLVAAIIVVICGSCAHSGLRIEFMSWLSAGWNRAS